MSETIETDVPPVESPPAAGRSPETAEDPRARLHELARCLRRVGDRRMWMEYLRLRRTMR